MRRYLYIACAAIVTAFAAEAATPPDAIKYRQAAMSALSGHAAAFSLIFSGKVEHQKYLLAHAEAIAAISEHVVDMFPAGSDTGKTTALPLIWQDAEGFRKAADTTRVAAAGFRDAVKSGDKAAIGKAMKPLFDGCKGCHDRYRKED